MSECYNSHKKKLGGHMGTILTPADSLKAMRVCLINFEELCGCLYVVIATVRIWGDRI